MGGGVAALDDVGIQERSGIGGRDVPGEFTSHCGQNVRYVVPEDLTDRGTDGSTVTFDQMGLLEWFEARVLFG